MSKGGRPELKLSPSRIKWAIKSTQSMRQASNYLNVSLNTFKKYAKQYDLWAPLSTNKGIKRSSQGRIQYDIEKILSGEHPSPYREATLLTKSIKEMYIEPCCSNCNKDFSHVVGKKLPPLILDFLDKNPQNTKLDNLRVLCFCCVYELSFIPKGWYRHRDNPIVQAYDEIPLNIDVKMSELPSEAEEVEYIPFENFQKMLDIDE